ncbi:FIG028220: hypothetical protein co-occurring with HEAT repeat protein [hydrothermal vent metagenome]|uniref:Gamma-butyrobetaine hydroxylase-like N-terminal domain-containing protein n=1 Tax=hydrothermal vent metagenome TaxID=652676 RepID=A0A1W1DUE4_9ZZZZ
MKAPSNITLNKEKNLLTVTFDGVEYPMTTEYLRTHSPSAEVVGHGPGQETLQLGKENVTIKRIEPTGNYAIILFFSDGHDSGIYSWEHLYNLATEHNIRWQNYLTRLKDAGHSHSQH